MELPEAIYSVDSVRNMDRAAINDEGIAGYTLMTRAGESAVNLARSRYPGAGRWQVICGGGNNGGDGYVVARLAAAHDIAVSVVAMSAPDKLKGDAATAYADFLSDGGRVESFDGELDPDADLLIDALLGSGLERDVEGAFADVVRAMNAHDAPTLAIDVPSGLHGESGKVMGSSVVADATITFVGLKSGLFLGEGPDRAGSIAFAGLGIPESCRDDEQPVFRRIDRHAVSAYLPRRPRASHKGDFGHVLVVGGGEGMPGAVRLCGIAALRAGAGLVSVATHPAHSASIPAGTPELMCHAIESPDDIAPLLERATVVALGPGLGTGQWSGALFDAVWDVDRPVVVDADALNLLASKGLRRDDWILTPHPGEAARLLSTSVPDVQADRRAAVSSLAEKFGGTAVLKGSGTLISSTTGATWLCDGGNPGMSSAGMGDVLTGIIAGLRAQGLDSEQAAAVGVSIHAAAGDRAAAAGERGTVASDLLAEIRHCVNP